MGAASSASNYERLPVFDAGAQTGSGGVSAFRISLELLRPLQDVYRLISQSSEWKSHNRFKGHAAPITQIKVPPFAFAANTGLTYDMTWLWAMDEATLRLFEPILQATLKAGLGAGSMGISSQLEVWTACFIIVKGSAVPEDDVNFHNDYASMATSADARPGFAYTLLTPLFDFPEEVGGLECQPWDEPWDPATGSEEMRIEYGVGKVVAVDAMLFHRTEPYNLGSDYADFERVLVSLDVHPATPDHLVSKCRRDIRTQLNEYTYVRPNQWDSAEHSDSEDSSTEEEIWLWCH